MLLVIDGQYIMEESWVWQRLKDQYEVRFIDGKDFSDEDLKDIINDYKYILNGSRIMSYDLLKDLNDLEYIGILATGHNFIDLRATREKNITVTNVPNYSTEIVAQHTFALLLAICSNLSFYSSEVDQGRWPKDTTYYDTRPIIELWGKNLGIIGYGEIGKRLGEIGKGLGMKISFYDKKEMADKRQVSTDEIFEKSDVISLHLPLTEETEEIINKSSIKKMKDGVILLNTARGRLINEGDLAEALKAGKVYGAGLDVVAEEPIRKDNPLLSCPNALITPHMAWASKEARGRLLEIGYDNFQAYLQGHPKNIVRP